MGANELNWFSPTENPPDPFVSVLVYMPGEAPLPAVHEGYLSEDGVWWSNGFLRGSEEIQGWADMPCYTKPDTEGTITVDRKALISRFQRIHKEGFRDGFNACYAQKEKEQMGGRLDFEKLPRFRESELKNRLDDVFQLIDEGKGPAIIQMENGKDFIVFSWADYMERFGFLYSQEEIDAIINGCKETEDT